MLADEDSVQEPEDAVLTAGDPSNAISTAAVLDLAGLQAAVDRYKSSRNVLKNSHYAKRAFQAEFDVCLMRDAIGKEFHKLKKTLAEEHEELPFQNLASTDVQDEITLTYTGPNPYNYPALSLDASAIRLVVLLPSLERHADIVCELCNSALTKLVSDGFEALSYVWGDPTRRRPIVVSRQPFQATENLEAALRSLRYHTKPRVLWIDAICINQNNVQERNEQVQLMGHIYRCARRVIVWLGPESDTSGAAFNLMRNKPDQPDFASAAPQEIQAFWVSFVPGLLSFLRLLRRPWFSRVWCIQELVLARAIDFQCGQHYATMTDFLWMEEVMDMDERQLYTLTMIADTEIGTGNMSKGLFSFRKLAYLHEKLLHTDVPGMSPKVKISDSALDFLNIFQNWHCSNDKDRIFAFYGLAAPGSPDRDALRPNYSLSVAQVYIRFAVRYLQQHKDLNIFITATRPRLGFVDIGAARELPSWVPDWRDVPMDKTCEIYSTTGASDLECMIYPFIMRHNAVYDACLGLQAAPLEFLHDFRTLCLDGVAVDKIEEIGPPFLPGLLKVRVIPQTFSSWQDIAAPSVERDYPFTGEYSYEAYWRTLHGDGQHFRIVIKDDMDYMARQNVIQYHKRVGSTRWRIPPGDSDIPPDGGDNMRALETLGSPYGPALGRTFFRTVKGLFGLGSTSAGVHDEVAVLFGGNVPFILRPDGESHRVIGDCYVHGIMDGEAIHRPRRREFVDLSTKEFHLV